MSLFKLAVKEKYRFPFKGNINVEDLFDLSSNQLNQVYKELKSQIKNEEDSLLEAKSKLDVELENKIKIVKEIFDDKQKERDAAIEALKDKQRKQKIREVIEKKKDAALENLSVEELEAMLK